MAMQMWTRSTIDSGVLRLLWNQVGQSVSTGQTQTKGQVTAKTTRADSGTSRVHVAKSWLFIATIIAVGSCWIRSASSAANSIQVDQNTTPSTCQQNWQSGEQDATIATRFERSVTVVASSCSGKDAVPAERLSEVPDISKSGFEGTGQFATGASRSFAPEARPRSTLQRDDKSCGPAARSSCRTFRERCYATGPFDHLSTSSSRNHSGECPSFRYGPGGLYRDSCVRCTESGRSFSTGSPDSCTDSAHDGRTTAIASDASVRRYAIAISGAPPHGPCTASHWKPTRHAPCYACRSTICTKYVASESNTRSEFAVSPWTEHELCTCDAVHTRSHDTTSWQLGSATNITTNAIQHRFDSGECTGLTTTKCGEQPWPQTYVANCSKQQSARWQCDVSKFTIQATSHIEPEWHRATQSSKRGSGINRTGHCQSHRCLAEHALCTDTSTFASRCSTSTASICCTAGVLPSTDCTVHSKWQNCRSAQDSRNQIESTDATKVKWSTSADNPSVPRCHVHPQLPRKDARNECFPARTANTENSEISAWEHSRTTCGGYARDWGNYPSSFKPLPITGIYGTNRNCRVRMAWPSFWRAVWVVSCRGSSSPMAPQAASPRTTPVVSSSEIWDKHGQNSSHLSGKVEENEPHVSDLWCAPDPMPLSADSGAPNFDANQIDAPIQTRDAVPLIDSAQSLPVPSSGTPKHPVKLSLQEALPCLPHDNMMYDVQVNFEALMQPWHDDAMFSTLDFLDHLPDMTTEFKHMLAAVPAWRHEPVLQCHVFLDGSSFIMNRQATEKAPAAWAIIVILECAVQDNDYPFRFLCAKSHPLEPCQGHIKSNQYVGELLYDSLTAEATAMIWALSWNIQSTFTCHTCFYYDNMTVGPFTEGVAQWKCEWEYQVLKRNISTLRHFMQSMGRSFSFSHLKAHVGHPWSEAVDNLAKAVAKQVVLPPNAVNIVSKALNSPASSFAWLLNSDPKQMPAITALRATFKAEGPFPQQVQPDVTWKHDTAAVRQELATVRIGFASANVLTLDGGKQSQEQKG